jgi:hypothetical protein
MRRITIALLGIAIAFMIFAMRGSFAQNVNPTISFGAPLYSVAEGCTAVTVTLTRTGDLSAKSTVDFNTLDGSASQRSDYTRAAGVVSFEPNESTKQVAFLISGDGFAESNEFFTVNLTNAQAAQVTDTTTTVQIVDNSTADLPTNPIDVPSIFVCQQYHDFLNREPDQQGLEFWSKQIEDCNNVPGCVQWNRQNVSSAFFLSLEFQGTANFAETLYEACLGRHPHYDELLRDVRQLGDGVQVGIGDWKDRLDQNKMAFAKQFVQYSEFKARYPEGMPAAEFANDMFAYASVNPTEAELASVVGAYGLGNTQGRALAMRTAMETGSMFRSYYNRNFVLAEYFGYLRRDPNSGPDSDWSGYDFWLQKLNDHSLPGEDVAQEADAYLRVQRADMVRAFIESSEYRTRFGNQ